MIMRMLTLTMSPREFKQCELKYIEPDAHIKLIVYCIYIYIKFNKYPKREKRAI
jgi:hypothetical protein